MQMMLCLYSVSVQQAEVVAACVFRVWNIFHICGLLVGQNKHFEYVNLPSGTLLCEFFNIFEYITDQMIIQVVDGQNNCLLQPLSYN